MIGYVRAHRKLFRDGHWLAPTKQRPESRRGAWIDLIQLAQHRDYNYAGVDLGRGEFVASYPWLADRWCWSKMSVRRFIDRLISDTMVETLSDTPLGKVYLIVNYDDYQSAGMSEDTPSDTPSDTEPTPHRHHNKEQSTKKTADTSDFEEVWAVARKGPKKQALAYYRKAVPKLVDHATLLEARQRHVTAQPEYVTHLFRWIRDERWNDEYHEPAPKPRGMSSGSLRSQLEAM